MIVENKDLAPVEGDDPILFSHFDMLIGQREKSRDVSTLRISSHMCHPHEYELLVRGDLMIKQRS